MKLLIEIISIFLLLTGLYAFTSLVVPQKHTLDTLKYGPIYPKELTRHRMGRVS